MATIWAYIAVIIIWSTTPLGIKWSAQDTGALFALSSRMWIGAVFAYLLLRLLKHPLPWHRQALQVYISSAISLYAAMLCVYWGAQFIPSGLVSVLFGLTPFSTVLLSPLFFGKQTLGISKLLGMSISFSGLILIFIGDLDWGQGYITGVLAVLLSVTLHTFSALRVKQLACNLSPLSITTGGLLISLPLFALSYLITGEGLPELSSRGLFAIIYLGLFGSVLGFISYYHLLAKVSATQVALLTLITPVSALLLGLWLNHEKLGVLLYCGVGLILVGLLLYHLDTKRWQSLLKAY